MNTITHAILINSHSRNEVSSILLEEKIRERREEKRREDVEKISNVSKYEFTSIAVYKLVGLYSLSANLS